jgi:hypothetical protein
MGVCSDRWYPPSRVVVVLRSVVSPGRSDPTTRLTLVVVLRTIRRPARRRHPPVGWGTGSGSAPTVSGSRTLPAGACHPMNPLRQGGMAMTIVETTCSVSVRVRFARRRSRGRRGRSRRRGARHRSVRQFGGRLPGVGRLAADTTGAGNPTAPRTLRPPFRFRCAHTDADLATEHPHRTATVCSRTSERWRMLRQLLDDPRPVPWHALHNRCASDGDETIADVVKPLDRVQRRGCEVARWLRRQRAWLGSGDELGPVLRRHDGA